MMADFIPDPVIAAAERVRQAEENFLSSPVRSVRDEFTPDFLEKEFAWKAADEAFADTTPTSVEGALLKLHALSDLMQAAGSDDNSLELRHLHSLRTFLKGLHGPRRHAPHPSPAAVNVAFDNIEHLSEHRGRSRSRTKDQAGKK